MINSKSHISDWLIFVGRNEIMCGGGNLMEILNGPL